MDIREAPPPRPSNAAATVLKGTTRTYCTPGRSHGTMHGKANGCGENTASRWLRWLLDCSLCRPDAEPLRSVLGGDRTLTLRDATALYSSDRDIHGIRRTPLTPRTLRGD